MQLYRWIGVWMVVVLASPVRAQLQPQDVAGILADAADPSSTYSFGRLQARFERDDSLASNTDILRLYLGYATQPSYAPDVPSDIPLYELYQKAKHREVLTGAQALLLQNPVSLAAHLMMALSAEQLGETELAARYGARYGRLLRAIYSSGSGRSPETAMHVTHTGDIYRVLNEMSLRPQGQRTLTQADQVYDVLRVRTPDQGPGGEVYFNVTLPRRADWELQELERLTAAPEDSVDQPVPRPTQQPKRRRN